MIPEAVVWVRGSWRVPGGRSRGWGGKWGIDAPSNRPKHTVWGTGAVVLCMMARSGPGRGEDLTAPSRLQPSLFFQHPYRSRLCGSNLGRLAREENAHSPRADQAGRPLSGGPGLVEPGAAWRGGSGTPWKRPQGRNWLACLLSHWFFSA